jgi:hypothetical protein
LDNEYVIQIVDANWDREPGAATTQSFYDVLVDVDVHLEGDTAGRYVSVGCRVSWNEENKLSGYEVTLNPDDQIFYLDRIDSGSTTRLSKEPMAVINPGNATNHISLMCAGGTITAWINGMKGISVLDSNYSSGSVRIAASHFSDSTGNVQGNFDNLRISAVP